MATLTVAFQKPRMYDRHTEDSPKSAWAAWTAMLARVNLLYQIDTVTLTTACEEAHRHRGVQ